MARLVLSHLPPGSIPERSSIGAEQIEAALATALPGNTWAHDLAAPIGAALAPVYADGIIGGYAAVEAALGRPVPETPFPARPIRPAPHPAAPPEVPPGGAAGEIPPGEEGRLAVSLDQVHADAVAWARQHAAQLVTRIEENTREMIREHVVRAFEEGVNGAEGLAGRLEASPGFSHSRSVLIARTEIQNAASAGHLAGYRRSGVVWGKRWLVDGDPCVVCLGNEAAGALPLDEKFPSGDQCPTAHPCCECALRAVIDPPTKEAVAKGFNPDQPRVPAGNPDGGEWTSGEIELAETAERAFAGRQESVKTKLSKQETGALSERIALAHLRKAGFRGAEPTNAKITNFPVDIKHDRGVVEVKGGLVSNGPGAQQWRITLGQPGPTETARLQAMSSEEKRTYNAGKMQAALDRKESARRAVAAATGKAASAHTLAVIINPDKGVADVHLFEGFHPRIGWNSAEAKTGYVGSYRYMSKAEKSAAAENAGDRADDDLDEAAAWAWDENGKPRRQIPDAADLAARHPEAWAEWSGTFDAYLAKWRRELAEKIGE